MHLQNPTTQMSTITIICLISNNFILPEATKQNARPVHETLNENTRIDKGMKISKTPPLPYTNPLTNVRVHAQTQQAMFNAERIRQHRAQLQKSTKTPQQMDSYMKAYHESQENHQMALEMKQKRENRQTHKTKHNKAKAKEGDKITAADAVKRNQRSNGIPAFNILKRYQNVYVTAAPTYDQGVTIKPNGNVGLSSYQPTEPTHLLTDAVSSITKHLYPKQHSQRLNYHSAGDLGHMFEKENQKEISKLTSLLHSASDIQEVRGNSELQTPIDLFFYLKDKPYAESLTQHYNKGGYAQLHNSFVPTVTKDHIPITKDHIPITEETDDIEDPDHTMRPFVRPQNTDMPEMITESNKNMEHHLAETEHLKGMEQFEEIEHFQGVEQPQVEEHFQGREHPKQTERFKIIHRPKEINYFKPMKIFQGSDEKEIEQLKGIEHFKALHESESKPIQYHLEEGNPEFQAYRYPTKVTYYVQKEHNDLNEKYMHHNAKFNGIHHLKADGTVSPHEDDLHYAVNYDFGYRVHDLHHGNDFGHHESKNGDETKGHYHVLLPDGRMQQVKYRAGPEGFHADISYDHFNYGVPSSE